MQYWINHNGVQAGPVDLEGLKEMSLTSAAYVWHEGLPDWVKITQLPELQGCYDMVGEPVEPRADEAPEPAVMGEPYRAPYQPQGAPGDYQPQYAQPQSPVTEPCPPSNLVWAILSTVLCCMPAGVVAIIYAVKVMNKYREGDIEAAKRASETGAWWCIASIVLGIVVQPFASLLPIVVGSMN